MARRRIGQERLSIDCVGARGGKSLDELAAMIDWTELDGLLAGISSSLGPAFTSGRVLPSLQS